LCQCREGGDDAVDVLAIEEFLDLRVTGRLDLPVIRGRVMTAIPEIGSAEHSMPGSVVVAARRPETLHADADNSEAHLVARRD